MHHLSGNACYIFFCVTISASAVPSGCCHDTLSVSLTDLFMGSQDLVHGSSLVLQILCLCLGLWLTDKASGTKHTLPLEHEAKRPFRGPTLLWLSLTILKLLLQQFNLSTRTVRKPRQMLASPKPQATLRAAYLQAEEAAAEFNALYSPSQTMMGTASKHPQPNQFPTKQPSKAPRKTHNLVSPRPMKPGCLLPKLSFTRIS